MFLPKVVFIVMSVRSEVDFIHNFLLKNKWGWGKYILKQHSKLKQVYSIKNKNAQLKFLKDYIANFRKQNRRAIESSKAEHQKEWKKIEREALASLQEIMEISWPQNKKIIKAMISINPICPRFLNDWSFSIFYKQQDWHMKETIMHEACHFLYFRKWREVFPNAKRATFEHPYIEWHLSEILAPIILNDSRIQKLLNKKAKFYREYQRLKIDGISVPKYFSSLYYQHKIKKHSFEQFLRKAYLEIKKHKNTFAI